MWLGPELETRQWAQKPSSPERVRRYPHSPSIFLLATGQRLNRPLLLSRQLVYCFSGSGVYWIVCFHVRPKTKLWRHATNHLAKRACPALPSTYYTAFKCIHQFHKDIGKLKRDA